MVLIPALVSGSRQSVSSSALPPPPSSSHTEQTRATSSTSAAVVRVPLPLPPPPPPHLHNSLVTWQRLGVRPSALIRSLNLFLSSPLFLSLSQQLPVTVSDLLAGRHELSLCHDFHRYTVAMTTGSFNGKWLYAVSKNGCCTAAEGLTGGEDRTQSCEHNLLIRGER